MSDEKRVFIPGQAGQLEAAVATPNNHIRNIVGIVCHPHPLYGGAMQNKVVTTVAKAFNALDVISIRFNYRGVGKSDGKYGDGIGETDDVLAVIAWARNNWPGCDIWLAGFSFGAYVSLNAATQLQNIQQLISIAPAVDHGNFADLHPNCPWLVIIAEQDEVVSVPAIKNWLKDLQPGPDVILFPTASHFFHGQLITLREQLIDKLKHAHAI